MLEVLSSPSAEVEPRSSRTLGGGELGGGVGGACVLWSHLPPIALLLVQLQLILVNVEFLHQGITVGSAQVLVCVIQEELVVELFLPSPQLATGGIEFLFTLLGAGSGGRTTL